MCYDGDLQISPLLKRPRFLWEKSAVKYNLNKFHALARIKIRFRRPIIDSIKGFATILVK